MREECSHGSFVGDKFVGKLVRIIAHAHLLLVHEQLLLAVVLTPLDFLDVLVPYEPTNGFKRWLENSSCSVDSFAVVGDFAIKLVSGLPVLLLAFLAAIVRW